MRLKFVLRVIRTFLFNHWNFNTIVLIGVFLVNSSLKFLK
jgi:hypothetical protein